mgnify:CR=1 FL=1
MENSYPWGHSRRFNAFTDFFKQLHGKRLQKLSIDAGFSCPNRSGKTRSGGCAFCNNRAFNPSYCTPDKSITRQIEEGIQFHRWRYRRSVGYLAYFQAYSNTYAPIDSLQKLYEEALAHPEVVGLVIGTRPDCVNEAILDYLAELSRTYVVLLEFGIESVYDHSLERINRGHDFATSQWAVREAAARGLMVGGHFILGLPGESESAMLEATQCINELPFHHIKLHQLQLMKGTAMVKDYRKHPQDYRFFSPDEYIHFLIQFVERLRPDLQLERFASEVPPAFNLTPVSWDLRYDVFLKRFEAELERCDTWQGRLWVPKA